MSWLSAWSSLSVSAPGFWALIGHLMWVRLQNSGKWRSINGAGWSSLVARRAHNPKVVGSNPTPATMGAYEENPLSALLICSYESSRNTHQPQFAAADLFP